VKEIYIGSTKQPLYKRFYEHKKHCNNENYKEYLEYKYQFIRDNGGIANWQIVEIDRYDIDDNQMKLKKEREYVDLLKPELNCCKPYLSKDEKVEYHKEYYKNNKNEILDKRKEYYKNNKNEILEYNKEYNKINKNKISNQKKEYRKINKDKILEYNKKKVTCECGCIINKQSLLRHQRSKKHINLLNSIKQ
jgi:hypothetical protein